MSRKRTLPRLNDDEIEAILASRGQAAIIWSIADVQEVRPDLPDKQACSVLRECIDKHDAQHGINWEQIEAIAGEMFPSTRKKGGRS